MNPVALLTTRRRRWRLLDDDGRPVAELVDDAVSGHTLGAQTSAQSWRRRAGRVTDEAERKLPDALDRLTKPKNRRWMG